MVKKEADSDNVIPFTIKNERSQKETKKAVEAYWRFTERVVSFHQKKVMKYIKKNRIAIFTHVANELPVQFPLLENEIEKAPPQSVFFILTVSFIIDTMPEIIEIFEKELR